MCLGESFILQLHRDMLCYSDKDERQSGAYKFGTNLVEAKDQNGKVIRVVFDPAPLQLTSKETQELVYEFSKLVLHEKPIEERKADYCLAINKTQSRWITKTE